MVAVVVEPIQFPTDSDDELVRRCRSGDHAAFNPIYARYYHTALGIAINMTTGDRTLAEDLTQEAFLKAWTGIGTFRLGSPLKPWLLRIVVNRINSHRRRRVFALVSLDWLKGRTSPEPGPEALLDEKETSEQVRATLARLPYNDQLVLTLRGADLSYSEIAQATGWQEGTVSSRLARAKERFRVLWEQQETER